MNGSLQKHSFSSSEENSAGWVCVYRLGGGEWGWATRMGNILFYLTQIQWQCDAVGRCIDGGVLTFSVPLPWSRWRAASKTRRACKSQKGHPDHRPDHLIMKMSPFHLCHGEWKWHLHQAIPLETLLMYECEVEVVISDCSFGGSF